MFYSRPLKHYISQTKPVIYSLSSLVYRAKRLILVLIMFLLSFTQLPEIFAQEIVQQANVVSTTIKKQRVINLYRSKLLSGSTTSTITTKQLLKKQVIGSGSISVGNNQFSGTGSCIWDMSHMQWTGLQIVSGFQWSDIMVSSQRSGMWSGFDSKTMILSYHTGILMDYSLVLGDQYLAFARCSWVSGAIIYPGEQEYLSGLTTLSGSLSLLPPVFTGIVFQSGDNIYGSSQNLFVSQASTGLHGGSMQTQQSLGDNSTSSDGDFVIVTSPSEFRSTIDRGVVSLEKQKVIRSRNSGGYNKITTSKRMRYLYQNNKVKVDVQATTTIFTAEGQDIAIDNVVLQEIDPRPLYKRNDPLTQGSNFATTIEFGTPGDHLIFTQPIMITYRSDLPDGSPVDIQVQHAGQDWSTQGLSLDPNTQCDLNGEATQPSSKTTVQGGQIIFYTCGASTFSISYVGGASAPNFVDNGTKDFTVIVSTGSSFATGSVIADADVVIDFRPVDNESPAGPWGVTNCYPGEKSFQLIHPDGTVIALANAGTYTTPNTSCPQAQIDYDQQAPTAIVGGVWNLSGQARIPVGNLSTLNGKSPFGTWTLRMGDNAGADGIILYGFDLQLRNIECGDGITETGEQCDDSNTSNGDGCSLSCQVEAGRECSGQPSSCGLIPAPSGLRFHLDGSMNGSLFKDIAGSGFDATSFNGVTTGNQNGEVTMCFNGTTQYLERATNFATAYPFTMSTWMKSNTVTGLHGVMSYARSTATNIMYNIEHNATTIRQSAQNTTARYTNATTTLTTTDWFLVTAVYTSATSRTIYVNGVQVGTNTTSVLYDTNVTKRINIGRLADSTPTNYFAGCVDDVRFYTTELTSGQIYNLYAKPAGLSTSLVSTGSPALTGTIGGILDTIVLTISGNNYTGVNNGDGTWSLPSGIISPMLVNGTYMVTMLVTNPYGRSVTYTGTFIVSLPAGPTGTVCIESPSAMISSGTLGSSGNVWQTQYDYFEVLDSKGTDNGYYTTISLTNLVGPGGEIFPMTNIQRKGDVVTTLSGSTNSRVVLGSALSGVYAPATGTVTFLKRDTASNGGLIGNYGSQLRLQYSIPTYQRVGTYTGTITYTLYEN